MLAVAQGRSVFANGETEHARADRRFDCIARPLQPSAAEAAGRLGTGLCLPLLSLPLLKYPGPDRGVSG